MKKIPLAYLRSSVLFLSPNHYSVSETVSPHLNNTCLSLKGSADPEGKGDNEKYIHGFKFISAEVKTRCMK